MKIVAALLFLSASALSFTAFAGELYDIKMPDTQTVSGKNLVLNIASYNGCGLISNSQLQ